MYLNYNVRHLGQFSDQKLPKGNSWRHPGIARQTYCLTYVAQLLEPHGPVLSRSESAITSFRQLS